VSSNKFFVKSEVLETLHLNGKSYERHLAAVDNALRSSQEAVFEDGVRFSRVATFEDHVFVVSEDGRFGLVMLERNDGELVVQRWSEVDLPVVKEENVWEHVEEEVGKAVSSFLEGDSEAAFDRLLEVASLVPPKPPSEMELVEGLIEAHLGSERPWLSLIEDKRGAIESFLSDGLDECEASEIKYFRGIAGKSEYTSVVEYAEKLVEGLDELLATVGCSLEQLSERAAFSGGLEDSFEAFCEDLALNLDDVRRSLREASQQLQEEAALSRLCKATAERLPDLDVAVQFIAAVAQRWEAAGE